jgi:hypothetical protein
MSLAYRVVPGDYMIASLPRTAVVSMPTDGSFFCQLQRADQQTIYGLREHLSPLSDAHIEGGWALLELDGSFDFTVVGVLAAWTATLAAARIPIMALSSFATDYLLLKHKHLTAAHAVLRSAGFNLID